MQPGETDVFAKELFQLHSTWGKVLRDLKGDLNVEVGKIHLFALFGLRMRGPVPISSLARNLEIAKPNMTSVINSLAEKGWVERCMSKTDRRVTNVRITPEGLAFIDSLIQKTYGLFMRKLEGLSEQDMNEAAKAFRVLTEVGEKVLYTSR